MIVPAFVSPSGPFSLREKVRMRAYAHRGRHSTPTPPHPTSPGGRGARAHCPALRLSLNLSRDACARTILRGPPPLFPPADRGRGALRPRPLLLPQVPLLRLLLHQPSDAAAHGGLR